MDRTILDAIMTELTVPVWPEAGKALGFRTRSAAFAAARRGAIRTIDGMGRKKPVPTAWLRQVLCLENRTITTTDHHLGQSTLLERRVDALVERVPKG